VTGIVAGICCLLLVLVFYFVRRYQKRRNGFSNSWLEMSRYMYM
jgi:preprotein translocase subunit YajC